MTTQEINAIIAKRRGWAQQALMCGIEIDYTTSYEFLSAVEREVYGPTLWVDIQTDGDDDCSVTVSEQTKIGTRDVCSAAGKELYARARCLALVIEREDS